MKLHRISLTNFKQFENQTLVFKDGINALIGENNTGKTSILHAIAGVFGIPFGGEIRTDFPSMLQEPPFTTRIDLEILLSSREWETLVRLRTIDVSQDSRLDNETWEEIISYLVEQNVPLQLRLTIEVISAEQRQVRYGNIPHDDLEILKSIQPILQRLPHLSENWLVQNFQSIFVNLMNNPRNVPFKPQIIFPYLGEFQTREAYQGLLELQGKLRSDYRNIHIRSQLFHLKKKDETAFREFQTRMESNFHGVEQVDINLDHYPGTFELTLDPYKRNITLYGGGTQTFAKVFSIISLEDTNVILLDEPDAHLHASLANSFAGYLKDLAESKQIIFTTHLPNLIDSISPDSIISMRLMGERAQIRWIKDESELYEQMVLMGLTPTNYQRALLNRAEVIVFIEGPTDKDILESLLIRIVDQSPELSNLPWIEYFPVGKLSSSDLNKMKDGLLQFVTDKRVVYIRDRDEDPPEELQRIREFDAFPVHVWDRRQLESYLLDLDALTKIVWATSNLPQGEQEVRDRIEQIIQEEQTTQFSSLIFDYTDNQYREYLASPERNAPRVTPTDDSKDICKKLKNAIVGKRAISQFSNLEGAIFTKTVNVYLNRWNIEDRSMLNAKKVLTHIRREFGANFQNKEILNFLETIPQELEHVIRNKVLALETSL